MISYPTVSGDDGPLTWRGAGKQQLRDNTEEIHPPKRLAPVLDTPCWPGGPQGKGDDKGNGKVPNTIWQPGEDVENGMCKASLEVRNVGAIQHRLERGEQRDVDPWPRVGGNVAGGEKREEPDKYWRRGPHKLTCQGHQRRDRPRKRDRQANEREWKRRVDRI
jgi:hypothetical protein